MFHKWMTSLKPKMWVSDGKGNSKQVGPYLIIDVYSYRGQLLYTAYVRDRSDVAADATLNLFLQENKLAFPMPGTPSNRPYIFKEREASPQEVILYFNK